MSFNIKSSNVSIAHRENNKLFLIGQKTLDLNRLVCTNKNITVENKIGLLIEPPKRYFDTTSDFTYYDGEDIISVLSRENNTVPGHSVIQVFRRSRNIMPKTRIVGPIPWINNESARILVLFSMNDVILFGENVIVKRYIVPKPKVQERMLETYYTVSNKQQDDNITKEYLTKYKKLYKKLKDRYYLRYLNI